jgi:hypothetical protein
MRKRKHQPFPPVVMNETLVAMIVGLLVLVSSQTISAVQRPPYPVKAEKPDAGGWVIVGANEKTR